MRTINEYSQQAELAFAAYANHASWNFEGVAHATHQDNVGMSVTKAIAFFLNKSKGEILR